MPNFVDSPIVIIPPPPLPTPSEPIFYVKRLEEYYAQSNPPVTSPIRNYSFYYDNNNRVEKVGIKNYGNVLFDTATCLLFYSGNAKKPYMIITPHVNMSGYNQPVYYDTTYFQHNQNNQIISDSALHPFYNQATSSFIKKAFKRNYFYSPDSTYTIVEWFGYLTSNGPIEKIRRDSISHLANRQISYIKAQFNPSRIPPGSSAIASTFTHTNYINPLSKLNISGTIFSLIYTSVTAEVLGNSYHRSVYNSNILPYYLDFWSPKIPSIFYLGGLTSSGTILGSQFDVFDIRIEPWSQMNLYPSQISVGASTALGDRMVYKYYY